MAYQAGPFDSSHLYLQWGGNLPGGDEWSCGLRMASTGNVSNSQDPAAMLNGVSSAVQTYHQTAGTHISPRATLTFVKLNYIDPSGHYAEDTTFEKAMANIQGGGSSSVLVPNQVAYVVSLTTGFSRGPAHRGRFYLPLPTFPLDTDNRIQVTNQTQAVTAANALVSALNAVNPDYDVAVFSRKLGAPAHRLVTGVQVGRVLDTQRRRRNKVAEAY